MIGGVISIESAGHGSGTNTFTEVLTDSGSQTESGNAMIGWYTLSQTGTWTASFNDRGTDGLGTFTVSEGSNGGYTSTTSEYDGVAQTIAVEAATTTNSATETLSGASNFTSWPPGPIPPRPRRRRIP